MDKHVVQMFDVVAANLALQKCECRLQDNHRHPTTFYECDRCKLLREHADWKSKSAASQEDV